MGKSQSKLTPEQLSDLQKNTYFNKEELNSWYNEFLRDYPNGRLNRKQFRRFHEQFYPYGDPGQFVEYFFSVFDTNNNGEITFKEFICPLSLALHGNPDEKLKWVFNLYDIDHDGAIAHGEMLRIVRSVYKLVGPTVQLPKDENTPEKRVNKIFRAMDKNNDEKLTYEEFVNGVKQDAAIAQALSLYGGFA